jgi:hypothetical protein
VKAGLVRRAEDWPWSSVREYSGSVRKVASPHPVLSINRDEKPQSLKPRDSGLRAQHPPRAASGRGASSNLMKSRRVSNRHTLRYLL